jgi:hypothetical protein
MGNQILEQLSTSDLIAFLVSPDLLDSEYIYGKEMAHALALHRKRLARVIPVIVRPTDWEQSPLGNLQALPSYGRAVSSWPNEDEAWLDVTRGIRKILKQGDSRLVRVEWLNLIRACLAPGERSLSLR